MPETVFDEVFDGKGIKLSSTPRVISDAEIEMRDAPQRLQQSYQTLRNWADDATQVHADWPTMTQAQKDAVMREVIQRLGVFFDRMADLLLHQRLS